MGITNTALYERFYNNPESFRIALNPIIGDEWDNPVALSLLVDALNEEYVKYKIDASYYHGVYLCISAPFPSRITDVIVKDADVWGVNLFTALAIGVAVATGKIET